MGKTVRIYVMGREYEVPEGLTIMKALEYVGYRYIRGAGCRAGFCGACTTVYRKNGDYKLYSGLACQTTVEDGMYLVQIPFVPAEKPKYDVSEIKDVEDILRVYPEIARCLSCNTCTRSCPQGLETMDVIQSILRGDIKRAAELSFDCIQCGICSMRCPAEITHYHVAQLVRRVYGKHYLKKSKELERRIKEIEEGKYQEEIERLMKLPREELERLYKEIRR